MKKALLSSLAICALALSACTSEDVIEESVQTNAITFRNVVSKDSRAISNSNFGRFFIYGYYTKGSDLNTRWNIFTDTEVTKSGDTWNSAVKRYWVKDATYSFFAYSCENVHMDEDKYGGPSVNQSDGVFRLNYVTHMVSGIPHDLVFASNSGLVGQESGNVPVNLNFQHILSKIDLKFISEFPEGYNLEISNISLSGFNNRGTFSANKNVVSDGSLGSWSNQKIDDKQPNTFNLNTSGNAVTTLNGDPIESTECYMVPHHYTNSENPVKISFNIKVTNPNLPAGSQTILSNTMVGTWHPNWRSGTYYTYTVRISGEEVGMDKIEFGVNVTDWNNPGEDNTPEEIRINLDYQVNPANEE